MSTKNFTIESSLSEFSVEDFAELFDQYAMDEDLAEQTTFGMTVAECEQAAAILRAGPDADPVAFKLAMYRGVLACDLWRLEEAIRDDMAPDLEFQAFDTLRIGFAKTLQMIKGAK